MWIRRRLWLGGGALTPSPGLRTGLGGFQAADGCFDMMVNSMVSYLVGLAPSLLYYNIMRSCLRLMPWPPACAHFFPSMPLRTLGSGPDDNSQVATEIATTLEARSSQIHCGVVDLFFFLGL